MFKLYKKKLNRTNNTNCTELSNGPHCTCVHIKSNLIYSKVSNNQTTSFKIFGEINFLTFDHYFDVCTSYDISHTSKTIISFLFLSIK